ERVARVVPAGRAVEARAEVGRPRDRAGRRTDGDVAVVISRVAARAVAVVVGVAHAAFERLDPALVDAPFAVKLAARLAVRRLQAGDRAHHELVRFDTGAVVLHVRRVVDTGQRIRHARA